LEPSLLKALIDKADYSQQLHLSSININRMTKKYLDNMIANLT
jgi:hypothetical protein